MSSVVPGFEYDVFISYRQNDNLPSYDFGRQGRSGWVTEFVKSLEEELAATIKEPVSVYFDSNPYDGLLETHDVDDSLKEKLKCFIFIPVISQTYCDPKSFAWKHELLPFKKNASEDPLGLKIKLTNGNVTSRILPVCIHDLDAADKKLIEGELGGTLRGIDFIYRSAGVVRPLKSNEEDSKANLNHTFYRDQINKLARAVKELITSVNSDTTSSPPIESPTFQIPAVHRERRKKLAIVALVVGLLGLLSFTYYYFGGFGNRVAKIHDKSIAVLPFENMNHDPDQDYFTNGITEDILNHLNKISELKVKSRTSTLQYKETKKSIVEIGSELGVGNILEGSVRRVGDKVRVVVQLIDTETDTHLWSETYDRELKDILSLQSEIAIEIANALRTKLTDTQLQNIQRESSQSIVAYDYFLKAREGLLFTGTRSELETVIEMIDQAITLDPNFAQAYALKARAWFNLRTFGLPQKTWQDSTEFYLSKTIASDPRSPDGYVGQGVLYDYLGNMDKARSAFTTAFELAPNNSEVQRWYGIQLMHDRNEKGLDLMLRSIVSQNSLKDPEYYVALGEMYLNLDRLSTQENLFNKAKSMGGNSFRLHLLMALMYWWHGENEKGIQSAEQADKIIPGTPVIADLLAWMYYLKGDLQSAANYWSKYKTIEAGFEDSTQTVGFRARLGMVYLKMGRKNDADLLFREDLKIQSEQLSGKRNIGVWYNYGTTYYHLAVINTYFGNNKEAVQYLDSALQHHHIFDWGYQGTGQEG
jgi:TolB-like protein/Tfp pilus assembly protein PilF